MSIRPQHPVRRFLLLGAVAAAVAGGGLYAAQPRHASGGTPVAPAAVPVTVKTLASQKIRVWSDFSGRLRAVDAAEIRPEVGGRITEVRFEDGQTVKAGDILFVIDPRPYQAAVDRAKADLASAEANAAYARTELGRAASLVRSHDVAQTVYDQRSNAVRVGDAAVDTAKAALTQAELQLEHAYVRAPIAGRASRVEVTVGNLVQPGANAPLLTTIVADRSIYADFDVDEQTYMASVRDHAVGRSAEQQIPVELRVQDDNGRIYHGHIYSFDNRIDVATGTIRARAKFDNPDGSLLPGMYVTVRLADAAARDALLIPERAIHFDQNKAFVYVVGSGNRAAYRGVTLGKTVRSERIALQGVKPGDRVIVDGIQHVLPNMQVQPSEAAPDTLAQATAGQPGAL